MRLSSSSGFSIVILSNQPGRKRGETLSNKTLTIPTFTAKKHLWNSVKRAHPITFTLCVAGFIHKPGIVRQLGVDLRHLPCEWGVQLTGSFHTFQGTKILWNTKTHTGRIDHSPPDQLINLLVSIIC